MIAFLLKILFGKIKDIEAYQCTNKRDRSRDVMIIVCPGHVDVNRAQGAVDVLAGKSHARTFPRRKQGALREVANG